MGHKTVGNPLSDGGAQRGDHVVEARLRYFGTDQAPPDGRLAIVDTIAAGNRPGVVRLCEAAPGHTLCRRRSRRQSPGPRRRTTDHHDQGNLLTSEIAGQALKTFRRSEPTGIDAAPSGAGCADQHHEADTQ